VKYYKLGGFHWLHIGRLRIMWCIKREPSWSQTYKKTKLRTHALDETNHYTF